MSIERCPICGGLLQQEFEEFNHVYQGTPIVLTDIPHLICTECGEGLVDSRFGKIIEESIDQYRKVKKYDYNDLLTCEEVASILSVSYQVVTGMLSDGKLPGTKIGREWRIPYGLLTEYIQSMSAANLSQSENDVLLTYLRVRGVLNLPDRE